MKAPEFRTGVIKPIECVKEAWVIVKPDFWMLFVIMFVGILISGATFYVLSGAMICGIHHVYLKRVDRENSGFEDLWKGFTWFGSGLVVILVIVIPIIAEAAVIYVPLLMAALKGQGMSEDELWTTLTAALTVDIIFVVIITCLHTLIVFAFPLIVDRGLGGFRAMLTSARVVWKNLSGVAGLFAAEFVIAVLGGLVICAGIYFVLPLIIATNLVAYRKVFPSMTPLPE